MRVIKNYLEAKKETASFQHVSQHILKAIF